MASYRKRGDKWQAQIRRTGQPPLSKSFNSKADAQRWARHMEAKLDTAALPHDYRRLEQTSLSDILDRYRDEIVPSKRSGEIEAIIINAFLRHPIAATRLSCLTPKAFAEYRDVRLRKIRPASLLRELGIIQHALDIARKEWGFPLAENPVKGIRKPKVGPARDRRIPDGEIDKLLDAAKLSRNPHLVPAIELAVETGMRRGELLAMQWRDVDLEGHLLFIPQTKNGHSRRIPLSPRAVNILRGQHDKGLDSPLPISTESLKKAWQRVLKRSGQTDLRFHDLRHEAVSRFFELGLSMPEVGLISGHRDPRMLFRYTHLRAENLVERLR